jgi:hypothetical protein
VVFGVAQHPERVGALLGLIPLEERRGGVEQQQVDLQVEQVSDGEEHRLLHHRVGIGLDQQVHRPARLILVHPDQPRDHHVLADPLGGGQLGRRRHRPPGDQRKQHPLHRGGEPPPVQHPSQRLRDPKLLPQPVQQPGRPDRPR